MRPIHDRLKEQGHEVFATARDHAQTVELGRREWPNLDVVGGASPPGRLGKGHAIVHRARRLAAYARRWRPDVALSHGSYSQLVAARRARVPSVTMMDYEHQPANHVSFRFATRVIVPAVFPTRFLARFGARAGKVVRYEGYKEELYLAGFFPDASILDQLELDRSKVIVLLRPPPDGALYHRNVSSRFDELLGVIASRDDAIPVLLPRTEEQAAVYTAQGAHVLRHAVDGRSLLAAADLTIGGGGTMNRESALLGTPTYTIFAGRLGAVDAALIREGRMIDLRDRGAWPPLKKKLPVNPTGWVDRSGAILTTVVNTLADVARTTGRWP